MVKKYRRPTRGTARKRHKLDIVQALTVQYRFISNSFCFYVNKICSDKTKIYLDIGRVLLVSKL